MSMILAALLLIPFVAAIVSLIGSRRAAETVTVAAGVASLVLTVLLMPVVDRRGAVHAGVWLRVDAISLVFLLATSFLYAMAALYAIGYLRDASAPEEDTIRHVRRFYAGMNLFAWAMLSVPIVNDLALVWIGIEITTVVSALLIAVEDTDGAAEAAWKYVVLASAGLSIALLATVLMYFAGTTALGGSYEPRVTLLVAVGGSLPPTVVKLSFVLAVLGFGTKVGLVPVHTWLPDAHSEAPTPVSALLSGSLLTVSFYAILRYVQIAQRSIGPTYPRTVLLIFGIASLLLAALYVLDQRNLKRLLAYSSIEHMGILAIGTGFGATIALVGIFLHVLAHAAAKATAFFGAGSVLHKFGTQDMRSIRGGLDVLPWSGPLFVLAVLALGGMPPFGLFRSEFQIVTGGLAGDRFALTATLVVLVTLAFFGLTLFSTRIMVSPGRDLPPRGEASGWMVAPMVLGVAVLLVLGVHPPADLQRLLELAAGELRSVR